MKLEEYINSIVNILENNDLKNTVITSMYNGFLGQYNIYIHNPNLKIFMVYNATMYYDMEIPSLNVAILIIRDYLEEVEWRCE